MLARASRTPCIMCWFSSLLGDEGSEGVTGASCSCSSGCDNCNAVGDVAISCLYAGGGDTGEIPCEVSEGVGGVC